MSIVADPVAAHVAALERALRGPARTRRSMVAEMRHGLQDAVAAYQEGGLEPHRAAAAAVRDFGAVHEVAPLLQEELTACQARWTSALLAVAFPGMLLGWDLVWSSGVAQVEAPASPLVGMLARLMDAQSILVALAAVLLMIATSRGGTSSRRLSRLAGLTGVAGMVGVMVTSVLLHVAGASDAGVAASTTPYALLAYALTAAVLAAVTRSCVRSLRLTNPR